jgi:hypothetical protein
MTTHKFSVGHPLGGEFKPRFKRSQIGELRGLRATDL